MATISEQFVLTCRYDVLVKSVRAIDLLRCRRRQADARLTTVNELDPCGFESTPDRRGRHAVRT
jgi:hypothetical protein